MLVIETFDVRWPNRMIAPDDRLSVVKTYRPYFTLEEIQQLNAANAGKLNPNRVEERRQHACSYMQAVGSRLGFPRRTIATAQLLYHRFHMFFPLHDFVYLEVSLSALLVASKLEDTLKKLRDIQVAGYQVKNILDGGSGQGEPDAAVMDYDRSKLIGIERLILETISFHFNIHTSSSFSGPTNHGSATGNNIFGYVIKICRDMQLAKDSSQIAYLLAIDIHRTFAPLIWPPHLNALACILLASFLDASHPSSRPPFTQDDWSAEARRMDSTLAASYEGEMDQIESIAHMLIDVLIYLAPSATFPALSKSTKSPHEPSPAESVRSSGSGPHGAAVDFTQIKIRMRAYEEKRRNVEASLDKPSKKRKIEREESSQVKMALREKEIYGKDNLSIRFRFAT